MRLSRREIFDRVALGAQLLPALALAPRSLVGNLLFEPDGEPVPPKSVPLNPFTQDGKALVAMIHGQARTIGIRAWREAGYPLETAEG